MTSRLSTIGVILLVVFLAPAIVLTLLELTSLRQNEAVLKEVYTNQLEAVLFSVNNYSQDVADEWANRLDKVSESPLEKRAGLVDAFLQETPSIGWLFLQENEHILFEGKTPARHEQIATKIQQFQSTQADTLGRLADYLAKGFRKLQPLAQSGIDTLPMLVFYLPQENGSPVLCGLFINPITYTRQVLAPKMQEASRQKALVFIQNQDNQVIYTTEPFSQTQLPQYKPLWLMPAYELGILLKGPSLEALAQRKSYTTLFLIIAMNLVLLLGIIWVFRNVRKEVRLAQKKSDFVSNVSHEIRTPLSLISMFAETLSMGRVKTEEKKKEYYDIIGQESARLARTVNKILNFSKMEAGKRTYQMESVDLIALISEILHSYDYHLKQQGFTYTFNKSVDSLTINADKEAISEAFINLLDNAINYSENEKEMLITCEQQGEQIILSVTDKGIGIPESEQKAIFDKFYRVSSATVHNTKGTGLGLSLVKHIMLAHRGEVAVSSKAGQGSTFQLIFSLGAAS
jgi:two-component system phosphate regulon sensor histidine kinase PhoR